MGSTVIPTDLPDETRDTIRELRRVGRQIQRTRTKLDGLYDRRTALYLRLRDGDPGLPYGVIADHAGTTEAAVTQAIMKARRQTS